jgi:hypothetical protein
MTQHTPAAAFFIGQLPAGGTCGEMPFDRATLLGLKQVVGECRQRVDDPSTLAHAVALVFRN